MQIFAIPFTINLGESTSSSFPLKWALCILLHCGCITFCGKLLPCFHLTAGNAGAELQVLLMFGKRNVVVVADRTTSHWWEDVWVGWRTLTSWMWFAVFLASAPFYDFTYWLANDFLIMFFLFSCLKLDVSSLAVFSSSFSSSFFGLLLRCLFCSALRSRLKSRLTVLESLGGKIIDCTGCDICCAFFLLLRIFPYLCEYKTVW